MKARNRPGASVRGSALIIVLWVIGLMGILVSSFAFDAHLEARVTSHFRKRTRADFLAYSAMEKARSILFAVSKVDVKGEPPEDATDWYREARSLAEGGRFAGTYPLGGGEFEVEIVTEQARWSVNHLKEEESWEPLLDYIGVPSDLWPVLIDSYLDWTDADSDPRVDGGESADYYETLDPPYRARNGDLDTVDELLLIKGFSRALLYGGALEVGAEDPVMIEHGGLANLLTVYGDKRININAAPYHVLLTLRDPSGDADLLTEAVLGERAGITNVDGRVEYGYFTDDADMFARVPELGIPERREYVTTAVSPFYRITARGRVENVERRLWCVAKVVGETVTILRWVEDE